MNNSDTENFGRTVELLFVFSLMWSICASVDEGGRKKIDIFLREMEGTFPFKVLFYKNHMDQLRSVTEESHTVPNCTIRQTQLLCLYTHGLDRIGYDRVG